MDNKQGKTQAIIIILATILLVSSAAIGFFMYSKENQMRKDLEVQVQNGLTQIEKISADLKDARKQVTLLQDKNKEADAKINNLMDEIELNEGLRNELKKENSVLKDSLEVIKKEKENVRADLEAAAKRLQESQSMLKVQQDKAMDLESRLKNYEEGKMGDEKISSTVGSPNKMELGKIVIGNENDNKGHILSVDKESEFVICSLGTNQGVKLGDLLSVYKEDQYLGDVKVSRAQDEMSAADFVPPLSSQKVHKNDIVVPKKS